ncbi:MAG: hypothetical protein M3R20_06750, partial [Pseudomonadota bacterium]|nr:hypothetical protein [Pseudomonadota bacterium]
MDRKTGVPAWIRTLRATRPRRAPARARVEALIEEPTTADLETCARQLARKQQQLSPQPPADLKKALAAHERTLRRAYAIARVAVTEQRRVEPAAEWLLDNFYLIRNQIRDLAAGLARKQLLRLPRVEDARGVCLPRMYGIARAYVAYVDGRIDPEQVGMFLAAYQAETTLSMAELWAMPMLLRVALIERIAAGARTISVRLEEYARAEYWAAYLIEIAGKNPGGMLMYVADMARLAPAISAAYVAEFYRLLEGKHPSLALALTWAEQQLDQKGLSVAQVIHDESREQAADQVSIANCINSLRL